MKNDCLREIDFMLGQCCADMDEEAWCPSCKHNHQAIRLLKDEGHSHVPYWLYGALMGAAFTNILYLVFGGGPF